MAVDVLDLTYAIGLEVQRDVPLGPYTSLKIGGPADFFTRARGAAELVRCLDAAQRLGVPWLLVGGGSNMLVSDRGFRGLAIKIERPAHMRRHSAKVLEETATGVRLRCDAGISTPGLARWTASLGWTGLEWACGIPGTIGGAAVGNAGAYGGDMAGLIERVRAWFPDGERVLDASEMAYGYRTSRFKRSAEPAAILSVDLRLAAGSSDEAIERIAAYETQRRAKQPAERSCGSVFKNPPGDFSGRLIETAGLKGTAVGDAQISEKHGNFFVNRGSARAADVIALTRLARARAQDVHGVRLEIEILLAGDWPAEEVKDL
ncbi:MAG: UDP-N-acetylmuramate dehydrogenase [Chloroflexi bacterium]|nr:UDP-N-acetylmuramate dehydrogenase [Chloroflexota bacterium]